jgi:hypothetical protein
MAYGDPEAGNKSGSRGGKSGQNSGARRGTQSLAGQGTGKSVRGMKTGSSSNSERPSAQKKGSVMREATWNNMTKGARMKSHGTTSYAKYKAGKKASNVKGTSKSNRQMRGTGK